MKKLFLCFALASLATAGANAAFIAGWTFETSIPTTGGPLAPEVGSGIATSNTGGTFSNPAGFGSQESWSSNGWAVNEYFQFQVATTGYDTITLQWDQMGSATGPANFTLAYSTNGSSFTDFGTYAVTADGWDTVITPAASVKSFNLSSITAINDQATTYFRLYVTNTVSIGGGAVAAGGTGRVDNFEVSGELIAAPEPSTYALMGVGLAGLIYLRYRKNQAKV